MTQQPEYTALDIAKWFVNAADREAGDAITHLKVQKLLYYAQGWSLANFGKALFAEELEAWAHGPVAVSVWNHFRQYGYDALPVQKITRKIGSAAAELLEAVYEEYGVFSAKRLERMTHDEAPWKKARGNLPPEARCSTAISKKDMKAFFSELAAAA